MRNHSFVAFLLLLCVSTAYAQPKNENHPKIMIQAGATYGGVGFSSPPETAPSDAVRNNFRAGFHLVGKHTVPVGKHFLEIGLEGVFINQELRFLDPNRGHDGARSFNFLQLGLPLAYRHVFLNNVEGGELLSARLGYTFFYNITRELETTVGNPPEFTTRPYTHGAVVGLQYNPVVLSGGRSLGIYVETFMGTRIYTDPYHPGNWPFGGSMVLRTGIVYLFPAKRL